MIFLELELLINNLNKSFNKMNTFSLILVALCTRQKFYEVNFIFINA